MGSCLSSCGPKKSDASEDAWAGPDVAAISISQKSLSRNSLSKISLSNISFSKISLSKKSRLTMSTNSTGLPKPKSSGELQLQSDSPEPVADMELLAVYALKGCMANTDWSLSDMCNAIAEQTALEAPQNPQQSALAPAPLLSPEETVAAQLSAAAASAAAQLSAVTAAAVGAEDVLVLAVAEDLVPSVPRPKKRGRKKISTKRFRPYRLETISERDGEGRDSMSDCAKSVAALQLAGDLARALDSSFYFDTDGAESWVSV